MNALTLIAAAVSTDALLRSWSRPLSLWRVWCSGQSASPARAWGTGNRRCGYLATCHRCFGRWHAETTPKTVNVAFHGGERRLPSHSCFPPRNTASIARGLFTGCSGPSLLSMKLHQHRFCVSGPQAFGSDPGHGSRETCHARSVSRRSGFADRGSSLARPCDRLRAGGEAWCFSPPRERDLPLVGERSLGWSLCSRERGGRRAIPLVLRNATPGDHYLAGAVASKFV